MTERCAHVFCDDAGDTGSNLLDSGPPFPDRGGHTLLTTQNLGAMLYLLRTAVSQPAVAPARCWLLARLI